MATDGVSLKSTNGDKITNCNKNNIVLGKLTITALMIAGLVTATVFSSIACAHACHLGNANWFSQYAYGALATMTGATAIGAMYFTYKHKMYKYSENNKENI